MTSTNPGQRKRWVALYHNPTTTPDSDGFDTALVPLNDWIAIRPFPPESGGDSTRMRFSSVNMRYRSDVTEDTVIVYQDPKTRITRRLFVKGVQNVDDADRELELICQEVVP